MSENFGLHGTHTGPTQHEHRFGILQPLVDERLHVRGEGGVFVDKIRKLIDHDYERFRREFLSEVAKRLVPPVDSWHANPEMIGNLFNELLTLSLFCLLRSKELNVNSVSAKLLE